MNENKYYLEGTFSISDPEKKKEMNNLILEVLMKTGTCRMTTKKVNGKRVPVVAKAAPNKNGIVKFDYSIFEKKIRKGNYYDVNLCKLVIHDIGYNHFAVTMDLIMVILESYSETSCFYMCGDRLVNVTYLAEIIEELTGKILCFDRRARVFDTVAYLKQFKKYENFEYSFYAFPLDYITDDQGQFLFYFCNFDKVIGPVEHDSEHDSKSDRDRRKAFECFELLKKNMELKVEAKEYITQLLDMTLDERKRESEREHALDYIARVSVHLPGAYLVKIYSEVYDENFFDVWYQIGKNGYWDVEESRNLSITRQFSNKHRLSDLYKMTSEDDFLGLWSDDEIILSEAMRSNLEEYKKKYDEIDIDVIADYDTIAILMSCIDDLQTFWNKQKYIDKEMLDEFTLRKDDMRYKKAVFVLRALINDEIRMFSEFTEQQVREWILRRVNRNAFANKYWHYIDILSNKKRRYELLGF